MFSMYSEKGWVLKVLNGHKFRKRSKYTVRSGQKWICTANGCNSTLTTDEAGEVLLKAVENHQHSPCKNLNRQIISNAAKVKARKQISLQTDEVIKNEISSLPEDAIPKLNQVDLARIHRNVSHAKQTALLQPQTRVPDAYSSSTEFDDKNSSSSQDMIEQTSSSEDATVPKSRTDKDLGAGEIINLDSRSNCENSMDCSDETSNPVIKEENSQIQVDNDEPSKTTETEPRNPEICNQKLPSEAVLPRDDTPCSNGSVAHSSTLAPVSSTHAVSVASTQMAPCNSYSTDCDITILEGSVISLKEDESQEPKTSPFSNHNNENHHSHVKGSLNGGKISTASISTHSIGAIEPFLNQRVQNENEVNSSYEDYIPKSRPLTEMNEFDAFGQYLGVQLLNLPLDLALELQQNIINLFAMSRLKKTQNQTFFAQSEGEFINIEEEDILMAE